VFVKGHEYQLDIPTEQTFIMKGVNTIETKITMLESKTNYVEEPVFSSKPKPKAPLPLFSETFVQCECHKGPHIGENWKQASAQCSYCKSAGFGTLV